MNRLLQHVVAELCDDPDCEVHHPDVGIAEGTVSAANVAFFIAGAHAMEVAIRHELRRSSGGLLPTAERDKLVNACLEAGKPILALADSFIREPKRPDWLYGPPQ